MQRLIYKVCRAAEWQRATSAETYVGSDDDIRDGFIHFSTAEQLTGTLARHFKGQTDLVLISFDPAALGAKLKWEPSRGGQLFPHLYEPLRTAAALSVEPLPVGRDGLHILRKDL